MPPPRRCTRHLGCFSVLWAFLTQFHDTSTGRAKPAWGLANRPEMQLALPQPRGNLPGRADARSRDLARGGTGWVACVSARQPQY